MSQTTERRRSIRSFVLRQGRLTPGQQRALDSEWPRFGIEPGDQPLDLDQVFGRSAPRVLEIGFGNGESLAEMAEAAPETDFLGIEVHRPGVGRILIQVRDRGLTNLRVMNTDAVEVLERQIPSSSLDRVQLFFPDPWHKKRHHKRRIVQPEFIQLIRDRLKPGGQFHMATDWQEYAESALEVLREAPGMRNTSSAGDYVPRPDYRPITKFEQRGARLGHGVWDLVFERVE